MNVETCDKCGATFGVGQWYQCPHDPVTEASFNVQDDSIPGGMTIENMSATPMTFYSKSEHRAAMKRLGLEPRVKHQGVPGSDRSPQTSRWV